MNSQAKRFRTSVAHDRESGLTFGKMEESEAGGYVLYDDYDQLRRQLAEAEDKLSDANESWDLCKQLQLNAEAKLALAEQLLRRCLTALKIGECDMHYHLKSGIRVSLVQQLEEATKEAAK